MSRTTTAMARDRDSPDQQQPDDLELLLSLHQDTDRVPETPPSSPGPIPFSGIFNIFLMRLCSFHVIEMPFVVPDAAFLSDDEGGTRMPCRTGTRRVDMSAFRDVVRDCFDDNPQPNIHVQDKVVNFPHSVATTATQPILDKFSGLWIR